MYGAEIFDFDLYNNINRLNAFLEPPAYNSLSDISVVHT